MSFLKTALAVFILQIAAPPPAQPPQPPRTASIEGSVVGASGERLPKVAMTLSSTSDSGQPPYPSSLLSNLPPEQLQILLQSTGTTIQTVVSDADGKFLFENLRPGSYRLEAARSGFVTVKYGQKGANGRETPIVLAVGQKRNDLQIAMMPAGNISGRIVDRNGEPISRATVQALKYRYTENGRTLSVEQSVMTNDLGDYRLFWLPPGAYVIRVQPPASTSAPISSETPVYQVIQLQIAGHLVGTSSRSPVTSRVLGDGTVAEESPVAVYYPGTAVAQEAAPVTVRAAETVSGVNITALPARVHKIRGVTLNGAGSPESMMIAWIPKSSGSAPIATGSLKSNDNGTFEIAGVTSGSYILAGVPASVASSPTSTVPLSVGFVDVEVGNSDVSNVTVTVSSGFTLKGRIIREGPAPQVISPNTERLINLSPLNSALPSAAAVITPDGTFVFQNVPPGDYQVASPGLFDGNNYGYVKSIRLDGREVLLDGLHIRGVPEGELTVVVSMATGKLEGRILNDRRGPAANATIVVAPEPSLRHRTNLFLMPKPDIAGKFSINVPPGRYTVFAWEDVEPGAWFDADFMHNYEIRGHSVTIGDGNTETVEINVIPYMP